jgi:hypothetical protein
MTESSNLSDSKRCEICDKPFYRAGNYSTKKWGKATCCSLACFGIRKSKEYEQKILDNISVTTSGCWEWLGSYFRTGYGRVSLRKHVTVAHRYFFERLCGPMPAKKELHHICENKKCCNPEHLLLVSSWQHKQLSPRSIAYKNRRKTHCVRGHELTLENIYQYGANRHCKECVKIREQQERAR